jgi:hypothetical protein
MNLMYISQVIKKEDSSCLCNWLTDEMFDITFLKMPTLAWRIFSPPERSAVLRKAELTRSMMRWLMGGAAFHTSRERPELISRWNEKYSDHD